MFINLILREECCGKETRYASSRVWFSARFALLIYDLDCYSTWRIAGYWIDQSSYLSNLAIQAHEGVSIVFTWLYVVLLHQTRHERNFLTLASRGWADSVVVLEDEAYRWLLIYTVRLLGYHRQPRHWPDSMVLLIKALIPIGAPWHRIATACAIGELGSSIS